MGIRERKKSLRPQAVACSVLHRKEKICSDVAFGNVSQATLNCLHYDWPA